MTQTGTHQQKAIEAFEQIVTPYLRKTLGHDLGKLLSTKVMSTVTASRDSPLDIFLELCETLQNIQLQGYNGSCLSLFINEKDFYSLYKGFEHDYKNLVDADSTSVTVDNIFDSHLAQDLTDILGEDLVVYLQQVYRDEIAKQVGTADHERFLVATEKLAHIVPLLSEAEYVEKIKDIAELLKKSTSTPSSSDHKTPATIAMDSGIEQIIIPDLAEILGKGTILESLISDAKKQCTGTFPDEQARFSRFVRTISKTDLLVNMFGDHWVSEKQEEWLEAFRKMDETE